MELLKLDIEELVNIINRALEEDKELSVNKWCDKVGVNKSTLKSKLSRGKYIYNSNLRSYSKKGITSNITYSNPERKQDKEEVNNIVEVNKIDIDKLNILLNNLDDILELVKNKNITSNITIDNKETTVKTLRVNTELYNKIRDKAAKEKITIGSILNNALLDYLNKYGE
ncbi:hypothetical protein [Clostridium perfringens]|uniref:Uncharacterized protein n=3 Tax=Clostridium perfringens TaxID=1502 RepID=A0AAW9KHD2_CLOPF|nr:hypothetical protein [Clostridium perfringens]UVX36138.1 MAG: protein of unknown function DUF4250 [Bacteriophage sp.]EGT3604706.1 hypothetical protein [Clostridium perfringens]EHR1329639.1 hypothetical protein [Clostridium perfringens]EHR1332765.1 hypothetical protein [Clostridium perfringens]EHR1426315.1 hypothetical protein [Clostridium perfringens]